MTRYTNLARKRTYLEAGFSDGKPISSSANLLDEDVSADADVIDHSETAASSPPAKRQKKAKQKTNKANTDNETLGKPQGGEGDELAIDAKKKERENERQQVKAAYSSRSKSEIRKKEALNSERSEKRRLQRKEEKRANTTCFACREKGHAARDCPIVKPGDASGQGKGKLINGICYRCGSPKHTLSRCKKPENPDDPLPYASCYVCSRRGHLASSCPQNKEKGVYPNGGCCKLCAEASHLAKNCPTRKQANDSATLVVGTGRNAGADEDDFHLIRRVNAEIDQEEQRGAGVKKKMKSKLKGRGSDVVTYRSSNSTIGGAKTKLVTAAASQGKKVVVF